MNPLNLYSSILLILAGLALVWRLVLRRGVSRGRMLGLILLTLVVLAVWWVVRPVQTAHEDLAALRAQIGAGKPVLLEFQSPY